MATQRGLTPLELLVVVAIIGLRVALLLAAIQAAREAARRPSRLSNVKQTGIALHNCHDNVNILPAGGVVSRGNGPGGSHDQLAGSASPNHGIYSSGHALLLAYTE